MRKQQRQEIRVALIQSCDAWMPKIDSVDICKITGDEHPTTDIEACIVARTYFAIVLEKMVDSVAKHAYEGAD